MGNIRDVEDKISWLEDDILCMQNIIKSEQAPSTVNECIQRIAADRDEIKILEKELE